MPLRMTAVTFILGLLVVFGVIIGLLLVFNDGDEDKPDFLLERCDQLVPLRISLTFGEGETSPSSLEAYFQQIESLVATIDDRSEAQVVTSSTQVLCSWALVLNDTAEGLDPIDPPKDAADAHQDLVDAINEGAAELAALADEYPNVGSLDEASTLRNASEEMRAANGRAREACAALEQIANDNGIEVELELC